MELAVFSLFAFLALVSAVVVVVHRNPVYSTMSLVVTLFSLAVLFVLLGAPFIATLQVLIYAGAILVLFLFVIMLLNVGRGGRVEEGGGETGGRLTGQRVGAVAGAAIFAAAVGVTLWRTYGATDAGPVSPDLVPLKPLAAALFDRYLLAFEIVGLLLLVAVIAATVLARKAPPGEEEA